MLSPGLISVYIPPVDFPGTSRGGGLKIIIGSHTILSHLMNVVSLSRHEITKGLHYRATRQREKVVPCPHTTRTPQGRGERGEIQGVERKNS